MIVGDVESPEKEEQSEIEKTSMWTTHRFVSQLCPVVYTVRRNGIIKEVKWVFKGITMRGQNTINRFISSKPFVYLSRVKYHTLSDVWQLILA
jgi:hypothetical protein